MILFSCYLNRQHDSIGLPDSFISVGKGADDGTLLYFTKPRYP